MFYKDDKSKCTYLSQNDVVYLDQGRDYELSSLY